MTHYHPSREELERRIAERLAQLDHDALLRLDAISAYAEERARPVPLPISGATAETYPETSGVSRRKFLIGVGAGGAALAGTAIGGAFIGSALSDPGLLKVRALVALYEELEKVGLDAIVSGGLAAVSAALDAAKGIGGVVSAGIKLVDGALLNFERLFPIVRQGLAFVEGLVSGLAKLVRDAQRLLSDVTGSARPITDNIGRFFSDLLDKIPFGVGANVRDLINNLVALVGSVPTLIEGLNTNLIAPLRADWFTDDDKKGLKGNLLEPTRKNLLQPADNLVTQLTKLADEWQKMVNPVNKALAQRTEIRKQIVETQAR